jgi:TRAP-type mannitol/chloroaromatic compound transport system permease large subunit
VVLLDIYKDVIGFVILQIIDLLMVFMWPELVLWLPAVAYG